jgi:hypothetical protein
MSKNKLLIFLSIAVILFVFILLYLNYRQENKNVNVVQASLDPNLYDTSWLTNSTCEPTCWNGLIPGKTSRTDSIVIIEKLPFVDTNRIFADEFGLYFYCNSSTRETKCGTLFFEDGVLERVSLYPNYLITLDQAVEKLGIPDGYSCYPTDPGATGYELSIFYTKKQLILGYSESKIEVLPSIYSVCGQITVDGKLPIGYPVEDVLFVHSYKFDEMTGAQPWVGFAK